MRTIKNALTLLAVSSVCTLAACSNMNSRSEVADTTYDEPATVSEPVVRDESVVTSPRRDRTPNVGSPAIETRRVDGRVIDDAAVTGVAPCDEYLSSYKRCHAVAGVYAPELIDARYEETRNALVKQSHDATLNQDLGARCEALANDLKEVLDGKDCLPAETVVTDDVAVATDE